MKVSMLTTTAAIAALAVAADTAVIVEVTSDGVFYTESPFSPSSPASVAGELDSQVIWHYSQATGLHQKTCPMGNGGEYVFTGGWYGGARMFHGVSGDGTVLWQSEPELGPNEYWTLLATGASAATQADRYYLARTFSIWNDNGTPGDPGDDYLVSENNVEVCLFNGSDGTPVWTWNGTGSFVAGWVDEPGKYDCSSDGGAFALGGLIDGHLAVVVFGHESPEPVLIYQNPEYSYAPRQLRITADGSKVVFSVGATLLRVDVASGELEDTYNLGASTDCFAVSADGSLVAYGFTAARLAVWNGTSYNTAWSRNVTNYYAGAASISDDNNVVYFGFYRNNYTTNRIYRFDASSSTPVWLYDTPVGSGGNQDIVSWMKCSSDGRWLAVASWGCQYGGGDEVIVLDDQDPSAPVFSIDTPGSMWHVDISPDGTLITAAGKHVHANVFGSGTDVYMAEITTTGIEPGTPLNLGFSVNPNPAPGSMVFGFDLPSPGNVEISLFDLTGRVVERAFSGGMPQGAHRMPVSTDLANGLYLARLTYEGESVSAKVVVSR